MTSRMDKYSGPDDASRTSNNKDVYEKMYETREYDFSDIDELSSKEVMLGSNARELTREEYQNIVSGETSKKQNGDIAIAINETREEKVYNINDLIDTVKKQKDVEEDKKESLKNTQYNILTSLDITKVDLAKTISSEREVLRANKEELSDLLETISKGISDDLINVLGDTTSEANEKDELESPIIDEEKEEDTFYDGTVAIHKKDIESEEEEEEASSNGLVKALGIILLVSVLIVIGYFVAIYLL